MDKSKVNTKDPASLETLVKLLTDALNGTKSNTLDGDAQVAIDEYIKIAKSLRGFPNGDASEAEPRWKIPPVSPRAF